jgi:hypothetical protein
LPGLDTTVVMRLRPAHRLPRHHRAAGRAPSSYRCRTGPPSDSRCPHDPQVSRDATQPRGRSALIQVDGLPTKHLGTVLAGHSSESSRFPTRCWNQRPRTRVWAPAPIKHRWSRATTISGWKRTPARCPPVAPRSARLAAQRRGRWPPQYHTARFRLVPRLAKVLNVPTPRRP